MQTLADKRPLAKGSAAWRQAVLSRLTRGEVELPMVPTVATKVNALVSSQSATIVELTEVVSRDQVVASQLLKLANTMMFAAKGETTSLNKAIVRLGFGEVRTLVTSLTLASSMADERIYGDRGRQLQEHSLGVAYAARAVAEKLREDPHEAFVCGLFHDIGKMVLYKIAWEVERATGHEPGEGELEQLLERYHASAGGLMLRRWKLPERVEDAVLHHHEPGRAQAAPALARVVQSADQLCHRLGLGVLTEPQEGPDPELVEHGLDAAWQEEQEGLLPEVVAAAMSALSV
ncbi:MAG: HDOD domain-containing protein [Acidobacteriota bacterium]